MPGFFDKLKTRFSSKKEKKAKEVKAEENTALAASGKNDEVHILPVPGNTNEPPQTGGGLNVNPEWEAHKVPGPLIPSAEQEQALGAPKTREELHARAAELNS